MERIRINRIVLKNFESHENSTIEFDEGLNVIVGRSCSGKSSVLRALKSVSTPRAFCQSFVRHGEKSCTIRVETNIGYIQAEKGEGINLFEYCLYNEGNKPIVMRAPGDTAFDIANKILGIEAIRIENTIGKKRSVEKLDVNIMKQSSPLGILEESGRLKASLFDTLCGIEDGGDLREGLKSTIPEKKKKNDELISTMTQVKSGGYCEKKLQDERDEYNDAVGVYEKCEGYRDTLREMGRLHGIWNSLEEGYNTIGKDIDGIWIPDESIVEEFKYYVTQDIEKMGKCDRYNTRKWLLSNEIRDIELGINSTSNLPCTDEIQQNVIMGRKLGYLQQYVNITDRIKGIEEEIEKNIVPEKNNDVNVLVKKNNYYQRYKGIVDEVSRYTKEIEDLAVVCLDKSIEEGIDAIERARKYYKDRLSLIKEIDAVGSELGTIGDEIEVLNGKRMDVLGNIDLCPVTGKAIGSQCSVWEEKQKKG